MLPRLLLAVLTCLALTGPPAQAADATHPVTATPPLVAVPATPVSKNVQQRMRACNATADARKLQATDRETFIKSCMAAHHKRAGSRGGSEPKANP
jgi:psiF repeat-containing protein